MSTGYRGISSSWFFCRIDRKMKFGYLPETNSTLSKNRPYFGWWLATLTAAKGLRVQSSLELVLLCRSVKVHLVKFSVRVHTARSQETQDLSGKKKVTPTDKYFFIEVLGTCHPARLEFW